MFLCDPPVFNNKRVMAQWKYYTPLPTLPSKTDITRFDGTYLASQPMLVPVQGTVPTNLEFVI